MKITPTRHNRLATVLGLTTLLSMTLSTIACTQEKPFQKTPGDILIYEDDEKELILYAKDDVVISLYNWDEQKNRINSLKASDLTVIYSDIHITFCDDKQPTQHARSQLKNLINGKIKSVTFVDEMQNKYTLGNKTTIEIDGKKTQVIAVHFKTKHDQGINYFDPVTREYIAYQDGETLASIIVGHEQTNQDISKLSDYAYQTCYFGDL